MSKHTATPRTVGYIEMRAARNGDGKVTYTAQLLPDSASQEKLAAAQHLERAANEFDDLRAYATSLAESGGVQAAQIEAIKDVHDDLVKALQDALALINKHADLLAGEDHPDNINSIVDNGSAALAKAGAV